MGLCLQYLHGENTGRSHPWFPWAIMKITVCKSCNSIIRHSCFSLQMLPNLNTFTVQIYRTSFSLCSHICELDAFWTTSNWYDMWTKPSFIGASWHICSAAAVRIQCVFKEPCAVSEFSVQMWILGSLHSIWTLLNCTSSIFKLKLRTKNRVGPPQSIPAPSGGKVGSRTL